MNGKAFTSLLLSCVGIIISVSLVFCSQPPDLTFGSTYLSSPSGIAIDKITRTLFVSDTSHHRILIWDNADLINSTSPPSRVLCKEDFINTNKQNTRSSCWAPEGLWLDDYGTLWVADSSNNRVLWFANASSLPNGANATGVIGQPGFERRDSQTQRGGFYSPYGVMVYNDTLWVTDVNNARVLRFDGATLPSFPQISALADGVIGSSSFTTVESGITDASHFSNLGVQMAADEHGLYVPDSLAHRVLYFPWSEALKEFGAEASYVYGQYNFTDVKAAEASRHDVNAATGIFLLNEQLYVADYNVGRVLFAAPPTQNYPPALDLFGAKNFEEMPVTFDFNAPMSLFVDSQTGSLWVLSSGATTNFVVRYPYALQVPLYSSLVDLSFESRIPVFSLSPQDDPTVKISLKGSFIEEIYASNDSVAQTVSLPDFGYTISTSLDATSGLTKVSLQTMLTTGTVLDTGITKITFSFLLSETYLSAESAGTSFSIPSNSLKSEFLLEDFNFITPGNPLRFHFEFSVSPSSLTLLNSSSNGLLSLKFDIQDDVIVNAAHIDFIESGLVDGSSNQNVSIAFSPSGEEGRLNIVLDIPPFNSSFSYDPVVYFDYRVSSSASKLLPFSFLFI